MYPTTVHTCTTSDPSVSLRVSRWLAEISNDARAWEWVDLENIHLDTQQVVTKSVMLRGGYNLRRRLQVYLYLLG
jgi:hypothetical protein